MYRSGVLAGVWKHHFITTFHYVGIDYVNPCGHL